MEAWSDPVPLDFVNTAQDDQFVSASALGKISYQGGTWCAKK